MEKIAKPSIRDARCLPFTPSDCNTWRGTSKLGCKHKPSHVFLVFYLYAKWLLTLSNLFFLKYSHDCGLFTLKAIEHWDGVNLPNLTEFDEMKLRMKVLAEWFYSPANKLEHKSAFVSKGKAKMSQ